MAQATTLWRIAHYLPGKERAGLALGPIRCQNPRILSNLRRRNALAGTCFNPNFPVINNLDEPALWEAITEYQGRNGRDLYTACTSLPYLAESFPPETWPLLRQRACALFQLQVSPHEVCHGTKQSLFNINAAHIAAIHKNLTRSPLAHATSQADLALA